MIRIGSTILAMVLLSGCGSAPTNPTSVAAITFVDLSGRVGSGINVLVNTDQGNTNWVTLAPDGLQAAYPSNQQFGFVAVVLSGDTQLGARPSRDLSEFKTLRVQLRGAIGGEAVQIGIKDNTDPDDGSEAKKTFVLSSSWQTFDMAISDFITADPKRLYLLFELVFTGTAARTVFLRDVEYLP